MGYTLDEIQGKHHRMFVEPAERDSAAYREFWAKLNRGEYQPAEYKRIGKGGKEVWIQASYNPILDVNGKPFKVVKFATDVTAQKLTTADLDGQIAAIGKSQAVIEFNLDGTIVGANQNFLEDARLLARRNPGQASPHVRRSVERDGAAYREFWDDAQPRRIPGGRVQADRQGRPRRSGSRRPTTRSSISTASRSRSSSTPPTSPRRCWCAWATSTCAA